MEEGQEGKPVAGSEETAKQGDVQGMEEEGQELKEQGKGKEEELDEARQEGDEKEKDETEKGEEEKGEEVAEEEAAEEVQEEEEEEEPEEEEREEEEEEGVKKGEAEEEVQEEEEPAEEPEEKREEQGDSSVQQTPSPQPPNPQHEQQEQQQQEGQGAETAEEQELSQQTQAQERPQQEQGQEQAQQQQGQQQQPPPQQEQQQPSTDVYTVKWTTFYSTKVPILCQNENGACPILAVANILFLRQRLTLPEHTGEITFDRLIQMVSDLLLEQDVSRLSDVERAAREHSLTAAMDILPRMKHGLDINPHFHSASSFEFTPELSVFDLFNINLYHGWVVDPQESDVFPLLKDKSYNQVIEAVATGMSEDATPEQKTTAHVIKAWHDATSSQLTYYGLAEITQEMQPHALAILFRNNHFSVLHKHADTLLTLVTDAGFRGVPVVWETLVNVEGDSEFLNAEFKRPGNLSAYSESGARAQQPGQQASADEALARQLQEQEQLMAAQQQPQQQQQQQQRRQQPRQQQRRQQQQPGATSMSTDERLARQLQEQEQRLASQQQQQQQQPQQPQQQQQGPHVSDTTADEQLARQLQEQEQQRAAHRQQQPQRQRQQQPQRQRQQQPQRQRQQQPQRQRDICMLL